MVNFGDILFIVFAIYAIFVLLKLFFKNRQVEHEFTSIINHTFRTPLTRISWISKELERPDISQNEKLLYIQNLNNATGKLLEIVDLIVGVKNTKETNKYVMVKTSFRSIVEKSIAKYREDINKKNILFKISSFEEIPLLVVDLSRISFTIDTLIENAIVYTPVNGSILIDCIIKKNNKILFYIADTGIGLSLRDKMKIFSIYYRGKRAILSHPDGMGLRLYLSRKIINKHKGVIYAKSKGKNKGSVFFIELPINK